MEGFTVQVEIAGVFDGVSPSQYLEDELGSFWLTHIDVTACKDGQLTDFIIETEKEKTSLSEDGNLLLTLRAEQPFDEDLLSNIVRVNTVFLDYDCSEADSQKDFFIIDQILFRSEEKEIYLPGEVLDTFNGLFYEEAHLFMDDREFFRDDRAIGDLCSYDRFDGEYPEEDFEREEVPFSEEFDEIEPF